MGKQTVQKLHAAEATAIDNGMATASGNGMDTIDQYDGITDVASDAIDHIIDYSIGDDCIYAASGRLHAGERGIDTDTALITTVTVSTDGTDAGQEGESGI